MKFHVVLALLAPLSACRTPAGGFDYSATADAIALYRQDVLDVAYLADDVTRARVLELAAAIERVESALRGADGSTASSAAAQALELADAVARELAPDSEVRFYIALAKIALRHIHKGQGAEVVTPAALEASANTPAE